MQTNGNVMGAMEDFLTKIREKRASTVTPPAVKTATDPSDPTSQPVMKKDDGTQPGRTGARAAENMADVKKELGGLGTTGQEDANKGERKDPVDDIGTKKQGPDEVRGNVQEPKGSKDLPPSSHPSNQAGDKYSSEYERAAATGAKLVELLAGLGVKSANTKNAETAASTGHTPAAPLSSTPAQKPPVIGKKEPVAVPKTAEEVKVAEAEKQAAATKYGEDAEAGYYAAAVLCNQLGLGKEAEAQEQMVQEKIAGIVKAAHGAGDIFVDYMQGHAAAEERLKKQAMGGEVPAMSPEMMSPPPDDAGAGAPPGGPPAGGPPVGGAAGGGGMEGGGMEAAVEELAQALAEAGISPDELAQMVAQAQGGGGGGAGGGGAPPPDGGGAPPPGGGGGGGAGGPPQKSAPKEETGSESGEEKKEKEAAAKMNAVKTAALKIANMKMIRKMIGAK